MKKYPKIDHKTKSGVNFEPFESENNIVIQEKVDGENFRIEITRDFKIEGIPMTEYGFRFGSRNVDNINKDSSYGHAIRKLDDEAEFRPKDIDNMFTMLSKHYEEPIHKVTVFGEYMPSSKPKKIPYDRHPKNYVAVFDVMVSNEEEYAFLHPADVNYGKICDTLQVDQVPILYIGNGSNMQDFIKTNEAFFDKESYLGNHKIEGTVAKNYDNFLDEKGVKMVSHSYGGDRLGLPMIKFVQPHLQEHAYVEKADTRTIEGIAQFVGDRCITEGRVYKALTKLEFENQEQCDRTNTREIIKEVMNDVLVEEDDHIKKMLYKEFKSKFGTNAKKIVQTYFKLLEDRLMEDAI